MDNKKIKTGVTFVSIILLGFVILLYFLDTSLDWGVEKIVSCVIVSIWMFFMPQMITYFLCKMKNSNIQYSVRLGVSIGVGGFIGLLIAPYYGIMFYKVDLNELRYNGEFFL